MKIDILAIGVHPDDVELACSGTLLKMIDQGKTVGLLDLTRGELGTRGTAKIRDKEAAASAKKMGAKFRINLKMSDGFVDDSKANKIKIIEVLREYQPDIVLANAIFDRHPDHGNAAKLTSEACFLSGLLKIKTKNKKGKAQKKWRPKAVYHYIQDYDMKPDFVVDIEGYLDRKMELIHTFKSQFYDPNSKEPASPISSKAFLDVVKAKANVYGRPAGIECAEGFTVARTIKIDSLFDIG